MDGNFETNIFTVSNSGVFNVQPGHAERTANGVTTRCRYSLKESVVASSQSTQAQGYVGINKTDRVGTETEIDMAI